MTDRPCSSRKAGGGLPAEEPYLPKYLRLLRSAFGLREVAKQTKPARTSAS